MITGSSPSALEYLCANGTIPRAIPPIFEGSRLADMVSGRQSFASWMQRLPTLSQTHPSLDQSAMWLRPSLPPSGGTPSIVGGNSQAGFAGAREMEVQTEETFLVSAPDYGQSSISFTSDSAGNLLGSSKSFGSPLRLGDRRTNFLPSPTHQLSPSRQHPARSSNTNATTIEISFVDEEDDGEGEYGFCDDDVCQDITDLERLLDAPPDPVWDSSISACGKEGQLMYSARGGVNVRPSTGRSKWEVSDTVAAEFGVIPVTQVHDMVAL